MVVRRFDEEKMFSEKCYQKKKKLTVKENHQKVNGSEFFEWATSILGGLQKITRLQLKTCGLRHRCRRKWVFAAHSPLYVDVCRVNQYKHYCLLSGVTTTADTEATVAGGRRTTGARARGRRPGAAEVLGATLTTTTTGTASRTTTTAAGSSATPGCSFPKTPPTG